MATLLTKIARAAEADLQVSPPLPIPRIVYVVAAAALAVGGSVYLTITQRLEPKR